jgi:hypothetical protein
MINNEFFGNLKKEFQNGKFEKKINTINIFLKCILQTSSFFILLSILIIIAEYNYTFENENSTVLDGIYAIIVYSTFYLIIFGVLPIFGILIHILNRKLEIEIIKIKMHFKLLTINFTLILITVLIAFFYYKTRVQY